jgi:hypothetical protein
VNEDQAENRGYAFKSDANNKTDSSAMQGEPQPPPQNLFKYARITMSKAIEVASAAHHGPVVNCELQGDPNQMISTNTVDGKTSVTTHRNVYYAVMIATESEGRTDLEIIRVDAVTGKIQDQK